MSDTAVVLVNEEVPVVLQNTELIAIETNTTDSIVLNNSEGVVSSTEIYNVLVKIDTPSVVATGQQGPPGPPGLSEDSMAYARQTDFYTESIIYKGEAEAGTPTSASLWRIRRIDIQPDGDISEIWADGNTNFDNVWDDRLSLTYM